VNLRIDRHNSVKGRLRKLARSDFPAKKHVVSFVNGEITKVHQRRLSASNRTKGLEQCCAGVSIPVQRRCLHYVKRRINATRRTVQGSIDIPSTAMTPHAQWRRYQPQLRHHEVTDVDRLSLSRPRELQALKESSLDEVQARFVGDRYGSDSSTARTRMRSPSVCGAFFSTFSTDADGCTESSLITL
jgi:hypothetical protein